MLLLSRSPEVVRSRRRMIFNDRSHLLVDRLFKLTDPHAGKPVELSYLLKSVWTLVCYDQSAVLRVTALKPMLAAFSHAWCTVFSVSDEACKMLFHRVNVTFSTDHVHECEVS